MNYINPEVEKMYIDPEETPDLFRLMMSRHRDKYQIIYGIMYEIVYSELALQVFYRMKLNKMIQKYRMKNPKKEKRTMTYYQLKKLKHLQL